jgi:hypothetical protein
MQMNFWYKDLKNFSNLEEGDYLQSLPDFHSDDADNRGYLNRLMNIKMNAQ